ncbi:glycosyltransferase [Nakamurella deserti]|uniref:glycosyltransferase n=1 Tax=Nakamurella deserti TaxID=2164074 RepID=UPI000DBE2E93|nr:glycosyltransferase [Nakamurella deserti]
MRVALVSEHASPLACLGGVDAGGQNVHVAALAAALARRGDRVRVYTRADGPGLPPVVPMSAGVDVVHVPAGPAAPVAKDELLPFMPAFGDGLERAWQVDPPDVVHAHFWMSGWAAQRALTGSAVPLLQTFHALGTVKRRWQGAADTSPPERLGIEAGLARSVDRIVATCRDEVTELRALDAPRTPIDIVPCGVDLDLFTPGPTAPSPGRPRLLVLGRLVARKGIADAVRAMRRLPGAELVVAGGPDRSGLGADPEAVALTALAAELGVADRVHLVGRVDRADLPALIRSCAAVLAVPWYEPFGIVPLEAMACGVPVVATAVGGLTDTVVDGVTGVLVPPRDPAALAAAVERLLADDGRRQSMGRAGAHRARARYGWDDVARLTGRSYDAALGSVVAGAGSAR